MRAVWWCLSSVLAALLSAETRRSPAEFAAFLSLAQQEGIVWAVGERGLVLTSGDEGQSWTTLTRPCPATLCTVLTSPRETWVGGHRGEVWRTRDQGQTWEPCAKGLQGTDAVFGLHRFADGTLVAWGAFGLVARWNEADSQWERLPLPSDAHMYQALAPRGQDFLWLVGERGERWFLSASGSLQADHAPPGGASLHAALCLRDGSFLVGGLGGHLNVLRPAAPAWEKVETPTGAARLSALLQLRNGRLLAAGPPGIWWWSYDNALRFVAQPSPVPGAIASLLELPSGALLVAGETGLRRVEAPIPSLP